MQKYLEGVVKATFESIDSQAQPIKQVKLGVASVGWNEYLDLHQPFLDRIGHDLCVQSFLSGFLQGF